MKELIIGVDVGGTNIRCATVSKTKGILDYREERVADKHSEKEINKQLFKLIDSVFSDKIKGIGIGVPAIVDLKKGTLHEAFNLPGWRKVNLKNLIEKRYKVPVLINNDANCFALGEKYFGSAKRYQNVVGLIIGTGFGAGIIIDGRLYNGRNCAAGEFGRILLKNKTIEDYCSGKFFIKNYHLSGKELHELAKKYDRKSLKVLEEFGANLGLGISAVVNSIDPEIIVLGGSVSTAYNFFKKPLLLSLKKNVYKQVYKNLKIKTSKNKRMGVLGAASLFLDDTK